MLEIEVRQVALRGCTLATTHKQVTIYFYETLKENAVQRMKSALDGQIAAS